MSRPAASRADVLVFFGATGDLAYKKVFPSLQAMLKHGHLDMPVIGVAHSGWTLGQLRERARVSLQEHGGLDQTAFAKLVALLRHVDGDYADAATFSALRRELGDALVGDATLFAREDHVEEAWRIVDPALAAATPLHRYAQGTWGPIPAREVGPALGRHDPQA